MSDMLSLPLPNSLTVSHQAAAAPGTVTLCGIALRWVDSKWMKEARTNG